MLRLTQEVFAERRQRLLAALPENTAVLLPTNPERTRSNDTEFPYRPASNFYYLTGFDEPEAWALLRKGSQPQYTLFVLPKDPEREVWTGIRTGVEAATERLGADQAFSIEELDDELPALLEGLEGLYFEFGRQPEVEPRLTRLLNKLRKGRKPGLGPSSLHDADDFLAEFRLLKTEPELALMRKGAEITGEAHRLAMEQVRPGMFEYEIQALIEYTFRRRGAWGWAYPSIVGGGANACILHYVRNDSAFGEGDLMLIDAGAEVDGYATDVTRTSPVSGRFTAPQRDLYQLVLDVEEEAVQAVAPGATLDGIHEGVLRLLSQGMLDLGLLKGSLDEVLEQKLFRRYFMHRTSHWLGMDVHDVGRYSLRSGEPRPLAPGMVLTVEPGIYVAPDDEEAPAAFRGIGIRVEDDVLVTPGGFENLTGWIPRTVEEIEGLRS